MQILERRHDELHMIGVHAALHILERRLNKLHILECRRNALHTLACRIDELHAPERTYAALHII